MEILNRTNIKSTVSKTTLTGYGKITIADKALEPYVNKKVEITISVKEIK